MYVYLTIKELIAIEEYKKIGYSIRKVSQKTKVSKSTVHRIYQLLKLGLTPIEISYQINENMHKAGRKLILLSDSKIEEINHLLKNKGFAPDIIAHTLKEKDPKSISTKTLYNMFNTGRNSLKVTDLLRKGKNKPHKTVEKRGKMPNHKTIDDRNKEFPDIKETKDFGHLEGDTIVGKDHQSSIITLADIWSKTTIPLFTISHRSEDVAQSLIKFISSLPFGTIKTITFDCGKEFAKWKLIEDTCGIKIYFADPGCPGQRGLNENNNGILRRYLPKSTDLSVHTQKKLNEIALKINSTPRKSLNYKSSRDLIQLF